MKIPPLSNASSAGGAQMGRQNILPVDAPDIKLSLRRLKFIDGDYDQGGAYWGSPANVYRAVSETEHWWVSNWDGSVQTKKRPVEVFVRAANHEQAKVEVRKVLPKARFYR